MSRVLIFDPRHECEECPLGLSSEVFDLVRCRERREVLESLSEHRPDAIVYVLVDLDADRCVLSMVRRLAPTLPMILLGGPAGLEARRTVQDLRPTYYGVFPLEPSELRDAVRGAMRHR